MSSYQQQNSRIQKDIQNQNQLIKLVKEQGYLEPLCNSCQIDNQEVQQSELLTLNQSLQQLLKQIEGQDEKIHLDMLNIDSLKSKISNIAKGFVFIASKYSKISQHLSNFEKTVSYWCDLPSQIKIRIQLLMESLSKDKSEANFQKVVKEREAILVNVKNNNSFLENEEDLEKRRQYIYKLENYTEKLKDQIEICNFIADKIFSNLDYEKFQVNFREIADQNLASKFKYKLNDESLEGKLQQVQSELNTCKQQKKSIENMYLNLKNYLSQTGIKVPETVLQINCVMSPSKRDLLPSKNQNKNEELETDQNLIENSKEMILRLMQNNTQLNELAKKVIEENKSLKQKINSYVDKINSISPIISLSNQKNTTLNSHPQNLKNSLVTQVSEIQQVSSFSPNPKSFKSPTSTKQKVVFESIRNSYSKSPLKKYYALDNTVQSIDIECSQTLNIMKQKDSEFTDLQVQKDDLEKEVKDLQQKLDKQQNVINECQESISSQKQSYEKEIQSLKNQLINCQQDTQIYQNKCNIILQEKQQLLLQLQISEQTVLNLRQLLEKIYSQNKMQLNQDSYIDEQIKILQENQNVQFDHLQFQDSSVQDDQNIINSQEQFNENNPFQIINLKNNSPNIQMQRYSSFDKQDYSQNSKIKINSLKDDHKSKMQKKFKRSSNQKENLNDHIQVEINQQNIDYSIDSQDEFYHGQGSDNIESFTPKRKQNNSDPNIHFRQIQNKNQLNEIIIQDEQYVQSKVNL
ncbi:hypothetical protein TTHERM_00335880 (macronuclear) [Tetrahymena thermophila SB210]|uniref:Uncharacterized protein n=1 Tax=Tetrahymena thermophila (strain SB210) TaxID=312017 RepID=I7MEP5_TETTS|nr:hypothetical protein TTHERM_00335880 [Tetrahymena thermophila SB210]EAR97311.2 hypothetical protein TTHERM_00335880 [Tetrahymena thermophila SB210]|eukprot:XP_001017556.2 hypothetical protein TTHERM_00335880 [Tetrahymena thermophila SB210]